MAKYRKKPVVVEASQFLVWNDPCDWPGGVRDRVVNGDPHSIHGALVEFYLKTPHGEERVYHADWIITGPNGRYTCKPADFAETYELVDDNLDGVVTSDSPPLQKCDQCGNMSSGCAADEGDGGWWCPACMKAWELIEKQRWEDGSPL